MEIPDSSEPPQDGLPQEERALLEYRTLPTETILGVVRTILGVVRAGSREKRHLRWMIRTQEKKASTSLGSWKSIIKAEDRGESALLFTKIKDQILLEFRSFQINVFCFFETKCFAVSEMTCPIDPSDVLTQVNQTFRQGTSSQHLS